MELKIIQPSDDNAHLAQHGSPVIIFDMDASAPAAPCQGRRIPVIPTVLTPSASLSIGDGKNKKTEEDR
ncbi:hypothetical protein VTJ04DRAFT_2171 [Mycothermus thermophilus]|uniref:uncharacterized protein n=1 Tax=Humicola insolens TaxID=85995 RepID=UPI0037438851